MKSYFLLFLSCIVLGKGNRTQTTLHDGNNQLTARMFSEVVKKNHDKSVVLSAFSVISPLSQLAAASEGQSHDELLNAVGFPDDASISPVFALMDKKFNSIKGVELKMANRLYIPLGYQVQETFADVSKNVYHSEINNIDFSDSEKSTNEINTWVENQTNKRIKNLVDPSTITPDTRGVLVNALYFKGPWKYPFQDYATVSQEFHLNDQKTIEIQMMHNKEQYNYKESKKLKSKILELPYEGDQSSFVIILPNDVDGIGELIEKLKDPNIIEKVTNNMKNVEVQVSIPKFKIETTTDLKDVLIELNVTKIFGKDANLTKLLKTDEKLFVSHAVQKAFIEISEEGTEAAAANAFGIVTITAFIDRPVYKFIADHPFAFFLKVQDEILFNGVFYG